MVEIREYIEPVARLIEGVGVVVIALGIAVALLRFAYAGMFSKNTKSYQQLRHALGKIILLGLEILVAADIIATVATEPTMDKVLALGLIVLIRTFLSLSLQVELEGKFPWQQTKQPTNTDVIS
ncbi:DUF1622 domain-containing protein [Pontibacter sp. H259]|uniref:DUF1622 domain-containing protein n=1 Tax=Pontibacter sp. H259 TaxID=3133421 RepID=UPI0030C1FDBA